jgi:hypothetical protein
MPSESAMGTENRAVTAASNNEFGSRLPINSVTGSCVADDTPRFPRTNPPSQRT